MDITGPANRSRVTKISGYCVDSGVERPGFAISRVGHLGAGQKREGAYRSTPGPEILRTEPFADSKPDIFVDVMRGDVVHSVVVPISKQFLTGQVLDCSQHAGHAAIGKSDIPFFP